MGKVIRLTETELTNIIKRVISEQNKNKRMKSLMLGIGLTATILLPSCNTNKYSEENVRKQSTIFEKKLNEIDEMSPERLTTKFLELTKTEDVFKQYTPEMINSQIASIYKSDAQKHIDLCAEMVVFQLKKCGEDKTVQVQVEEYINKLQGSKLDEIDSLILKSFSDATESFQTQAEYELESGYLR